MKIEDLKALALFDKFSEAQLGWLLENAEQLKYPAEERVFSEGSPGDALYILIDGEWQLVRNVNGQQTVINTTNYRGSWVGGIPLFGGIYHSSGYATQPSCFLRVPLDKLEYMLSNGFPLATHLIAGISVGARNLEGIQRQAEKMAALGKLSAGLAHELNNPAAAARRASQQLRETLGSLQTSTLSLNQHLEPAKVAKLYSCQRDIVEKSKTPLKLAALEQSEREEELNDWLDDHNIADSWEISPTLVEVGLGVEWLENLCGEVGAEALGDVLAWTVANLSALALADQIEQSMERISALVKSIKEYSYMDQAPLQEIDVHDGLESTLTILTHKLKQGVTVVRNFDRKLPRIQAFGSELNQVWTNLIDNAIDAMKGQGQLKIGTHREGDFIVVEIEDNGPGIPPEIQNRIFEPFFTTKGVGQGTGLGLDIAWRIVVNKHKGNLKLNSVPGTTRFQIYLPI